MGSGDVAEPRQELVENQARDVEAEDAAPEGPRKTPWDAHKIRVSTKPWSLRQAVDDLKDGTIDLAPDFQRPSVWTEEKRSRLIESILLGIPLPALYFSADSDGVMRVVDGVQRLSAIRDFAANELTLEGLEYLTTLEGKQVNDLDAPLRRRFNQTQILVNVIEPETPVEVKFNIFKRINTGGEPLRPQEIRHALSQGRSRAVLKRMASSEIFHAATGDAFRDDPRLTARELALRFIALRLDPELREYETAETADDYLVACSQRLDDESALSDERLAEIEALFARSLRAAQEIFGPHAFRKWPKGTERRSPVNRALFESWSAVLADYDLEVLAPKKEAIVEAAREAFSTNAAYMAAITAATGDLARVRLRLEVARQIVNGAGT